MLLRSFFIKGISPIYIENQDVSHMLSKVKSATKHTFALQSPLALIMQPKLILLKEVSGENF